MAEGGFAVGGVSNNRVRIDPTAIKGEGGPVYPRLLVPLQLDLNPGGGQLNQSYVTLAVECGLFLDGHGLKISDATPFANILKVQNPGFLATWNLEFPLDPFRLKAVEARRHGDLKLRFDLFFFVALLARTVLPDKANQGPTEFIAGFEKAQSQLYVELPQSHWAGKILPALGSNSYFVVEIPTRNEHIAGAWTLIEQAESAFDRWDTKAVFAHCREAATALTSLIEKHHGHNSFLREERWNRAVKEFRHFASLDLHLEDIKSKGNHSTEQVQIGKSDAECLLIFVKALAKYAEELLRTEPHIGA
jgi:hypothetical protein